MDPNLAIALVWLGGMIVGALCAFAGVWMGAKIARKEN